MDPSRTPAVGPSRSGRPARTAARVVVGVLLVAAVAVVLVPDRLGLGLRLPFVAFVVLRPAGTVVAGVAAVAALLVPRSRRAFGPAWVGVLVVAAVAAASMVPRLVPAADGTAPPPGAAVRSVMSFNVDQGGADVDALAATIRARAPDVVVLPEAGEAFRARLAPRVADLGYRSWVAARPGDADVDGLTVLAGPRLGAVVPRVLDPGPDPVLELSGGTLGPVRVVGAHLSAPVPGKIVAWRRELLGLAAWCGTDPAVPRPPVVLAGDLNASEDHAPFRAGTAGCADAGDAAGRGLVATWQAGWPRWFGAQIDHVLTAGGPAGPRPHGLEVLDLPGSDHRALLALVGGTTGGTAGDPEGAGTVSSG